MGGVKTKKNFRRGQKPRKNQVKSQREKALSGGAKNKAEEKTAKQ